jgi:hypothetical protein
MRTYRLKFSDDGKGLAKEVEFDAFDAGRALLLAHEQACARWAELWCDGKKLCSLRCSSSGTWEISGARRAPR